MGRRVKFRLTGMSRPGNFAFHSARFATDRAMLGCESSVQVMAAWIGLFLFVSSVFELHRDRVKEASKQERLTRMPSPTMVGNPITGHGSVAWNISHPLPFSFARKDDDHR